MNRIKQIRERRGLTQAQLAELADTTQPTIMRLETGQMNLTVKWMQRLAKALDCRPEDLVASAVIAGLREDAKPYVSDDKAISSASLASRGLAYFTVTSDAVEMAGVPAGTIILIDMTPSAVEGVRTGDIVVAQAYGEEMTAAVTIVRQFVAPSLLVTNRKTANVATSLSDPDYDVAIKGVMIKP